MAAVIAPVASSGGDDEASASSAAEAAIREARIELEHAMTKAGLTNDPIRYLLEATSGALGAFQTGIEAIRRPMPAELRDLLVLEVSKATRAGASEAMRTQATRMLRTLDRRLAVQVGLSLVAAFVLGGALTYGGLRATQVGPFDRDVQAAVAWHEIEHRNPDPRQMLAAAEIRTDKASGRRFYAGVSLWLDALNPPPSAGTRP